MSFSFQDDLIEFIKTERTWEEITNQFKEHSYSAIAICLRQLEQDKQIKVRVKYHAN
jgi:hypothetical protein